MAMSSPEVRDATAADLESILVWLKREYEKEGQSFWSNRGLIADAQRDGQLRVAIDTTTREPVAFLVNNQPLWNEIYILAVEPTRRHAGLGTVLVRDFLETAKTNGSLGVWGECSPESSEPFWRKMGLAPIDSRFGRGIESRGIWRAMPFRGTNVLSPGSQRAELTIRLTSFEYSDPPIEEFSTTVARNGSNWFLEEHFTRCVPDPDIVARIALDGYLLFEDKVKRITPVGGERKYPFVRIRSVVDLRNGRPSAMPPH